METEKVPKRNLRKIFRNIWLFSMLAGVVAIILYGSLSWIFKITVITEKAPSIAIIVIFGLIGLVGGISFLVWISILIFSNKFSRIVTILLGIFVSGLYALTVYSIAYIYIYSRVAQDNSLGLWADNFALLAFGVVLFIWLKTKPWFIKTIIAIALIGLYFLGRNYAIKAYEPYKQAIGLVIQSNSEEAQAWTKETDPNLYIDGERKWVAKLETAASLIKTDVFRSAVRDFFNKLYQTGKEGLDYDEKVYSGGLTISKEEADKLIEEIATKRNAAWSTKFTIPFWTEFFMVSKNIQVPRF